MNRSQPWKKNRKRTRQLNFDLNRSTPHVERKTLRLNTPEKNTAEIDTEMSQEENGQIRDLSKTIISNLPNMASGSGTQSSDRLGMSLGRQVALDNMEESIKKMVEQTVSSQVSDVKRMISELTSTVGRLTVLVHQTQQENQHLRENNGTTTSKNAKNSQQMMETSDMPAHSNSSSRASSLYGDCPRPDSRPRVDKWGVEFDGDSNKLAIEDFVFRVERLQHQYNVSWKEVLDNFHLLVKGPAEKWYWLFIQTNYVTEWSTLRQALLKQFQSTRSSFELMRDMVERRQQPGETIDAFFFAMMQLRSRLTISMPEAEMIKMIKRNLREGIGRLVYPMTVTSVEELKTCCLDAEKTFLRRDLKPPQVTASRFARHVNELYDEVVDDYRQSETDGEGVAEVRTTHMNTQTAKTPNCWNCRKNGHLFMDCPADERSVFCYRCGKPNVISPNCSNCKARNFQKNEGRAGDHRSVSNPPTNI